MKKTSFLFLTLFLVGILTSCHKEPEKSIAFGNTKGLNVTALNTNIGLGKTLDLDIDDDGTTDLKLVSYYDGPLGGTKYQMLYLDCLNENVAFLGEMMEKERYTHHDTTYLTDSNGHTTVLYFTANNLCEKVSENDEVRTTNSFILSSNNDNDTFGIDDCFRSKKVFLFIEDNNNGPVDNIYHSNDTTFVWDSSTTYSCDAFPTNTETYIGVKINKDGTPHLGWLKVNLIGNNTVNIHLIETAIQK